MPWLLWLMLLPLSFPSKEIFISCEMNDRNHQFCLPLWNNPFMQSLMVLQLGERLMGKRYLHGNKVLPQQIFSILFVISKRRVSFIKYKSDRHRLYSSYHGGVTVGLLSRASWRDALWSKIVHSQSTVLDLNFCFTENAGVRGASPRTAWGKQINEEGEAPCKSTGLLVLKSPRHGERQMSAVGRCWSQIKRVQRDIIFSSVLTVEQCMPVMKVRELKDLWSINSCLLPSVLTVEYLSSNRKHLRT